MTLLEHGNIEIWGPGLLRGAATMSANCFLQPSGNCCCSIIVVLFCASQCAATPSCSVAMLAFMCACGGKVSAFERLCEVCEECFC